MDYDCLRCGHHWQAKVIPGCCPQCGNYNFDVAEKVKARRIDPKPVNRRHSVVSWSVRTTGFKFKSVNGLR